MLVSVTAAVISVGVSLPKSMLPKRSSSDRRARPPRRLRADDFVFLVQDCVEITNVNLDSVFQISSSNVIDVIEIVVDDESDVSMGVSSAAFTVLKTSSHPVGSEVTVGTEHVFFSVFPEFSKFASHLSENDPTIKELDGSEVNVASELYK
jgi:hypothetical protein